MKQPETLPIRLLLVTEAWPPQINGVTVSYENVFRGIPRDRYAIKVISPDLKSWRTWPWPFYSSVKLEFGATSRLKNEIRLFNPDCIHIATEGPLGWAARNLCLREHRPFTTAYHTKYPEYLAGYVPRGLKAVVMQLAYATLRRFHATSSAMMVASDALEEELKKHKFRNPIVRWTRGANLAVYRPGLPMPEAYSTMTRPILLYVGRVASEKNIEAFLLSRVPGTKVVVGDGPARKSLEHRFPEARFLGEKRGEDLARLYSNADVFVFPSKTDTFGIVLVEAAASGLPIAAYPITGPKDVFADPASRAFTLLDNDLDKAIRGALALKVDPETPRQFVADHYTWEASIKQFLRHLQPPTPPAVKRMKRFSIIGKRMHWVSRLGRLRL